MNTEIKMEPGVWCSLGDNAPKRFSFDNYTRDIRLLEKILIVAGKSSGRVFGGFVRDVIVPRLIDPNCKVDFNDVDIWFTKQEDADQFVNNIDLLVTIFTNHEHEYRNVNLSESTFTGITFRHSPNSSRGPNAGHYTFGRTQYHLYKDDKFVSFIDIVVSETIPVDDFDVNCLTFQYIDDDRKIPTSFSESSGTQLIVRIAAKRVYMLPTYAPKIISGKMSTQQFERRINNNFLKKGWKVYCFDRCEFPQTITCEWVHMTFIPTARRYLKESVTETVETPSESPV